MRIFPRRLALVGILLLSGCVGMEDYERKAEEASTLRRELESTQARISSQLRTIDSLRKKIEERHLENEELSQSLTMARRHGQQLETSLADLRAQFSSKKQESQSVQQKVSRLEKDHQKSLQKMRQLEVKVVRLRRRLARFEDKLRLQAQLQKDFAAHFAREVRSGTVKVRRTGERVVIGLASATLFSSGRAAIKKQGKRLLRKVANILRRYANRAVQVQGHTDNIPISERLAERWETNWELSAGRATRVLRYIIEVGNVDPRRISAAGFGEFRPIADNATPKGRRRNRRIEFVIFPPEAE